MNTFRRTKIWQSVALAAVITVTLAGTAGAAIQGDVNGDNKVNATDLNILVGNYGKTGDTTKGDLTGNNYVGIYDLSVLLTNYGKTGGTVTPPPPPPPPPPTGSTTCASATTLVFCDDFESYTLGIMKAGDLTGTQYRTKWATNQSCPNSVSIVNDPVRAGGKSVKMTVHHTDVRANCAASPNVNPRAQLLSDPLFRKNDEVYVKVGTLFSSDFPRYIGIPPDPKTGSTAPPFGRGSYLQIMEIYGSPTTCSPAIGIFIVGSRLQFNQGKGIRADGSCDVSAGVWKSDTDVKYGTGWEDIVLHVKFSTDPAVGFMEIWQNGRPQKFNDGSTKYFMRTLVPGVSYNEGGTNQLYVNMYRGASA